MKKDKFVYIIKIQKEIWNETKKMKGELTLSFRIMNWVRFLIKDNNFDEYIIKNEKESDGFVKVPQVRDSVKFALGIDKDEFKQFKKLCRDRGMSVNYVFGLLIRRYNDSGAMFTISIEV